MFKSFYKAAAKAGKALARPFRPIAGFLNWLNLTAAPWYGFKLTYSQVTQAFVSRAKKPTIAPIVSAPVLILSTTTMTTSLALEKRARKDKERFFNRASIPSYATFVKLTNTSPVFSSPYRSLFNTLATGGAALKEASNELFAFATANAVFKLGLDSMGTTSPIPYWVDLFNLLICGMARPVLRTAFWPNEVEEAHSHDIFIRSRHNRSDVGFSAETIQRMRGQIEQLKNPKHRIITQYPTQFLINVFFNHFVPLVSGLHYLAYLLEDFIDNEEGFDTALMWAVPLIALFVSIPLGISQTFRQAIEEKITSHVPAPNEARLEELNKIQARSNYTQAIQRLAFAPLFFSSGFVGLFSLGNEQLSPILQFILFTLLVITVTSGLLGKAVYDSTGERIRRESRVNIAEKEEGLIQYQATPFLKHGLFCRRPLDRSPYTPMTEQREPDLEREKGSDEDNGIDSECERETLPLSPEEKKEDIAFVDIEEAALHTIQESSRASREESLLLSDEQTPHTLSPGPSAPPKLLIKRPKTREGIPTPGSSIGEGYVEFQTPNSYAAITPLFTKASASSSSDHEGFLTPGSLV